MPSHESAVTSAYRDDVARAWRTTPAPDVLTFHRSLPGYAPTRLVAAPQLADELGVASVHVKEEASRFGLPAFKMLGASYAISRALGDRLGVDEALPFEELRERIAASAAPVTLIAATDGNHGRAVARTARLVGASAHILVPAAISDAAKHGIRSEGAELTELDVPYDDVVPAAAAEAERTGGLLIQDTAWEGYEQIPAWIVDGYSTLTREADAQLRDAGIDHPDIVVVPVGVGSLAEAVVRHYRSGDAAPSVVSVEPAVAAAILTSLHRGRAVTVDTGDTVMAGLNCGTPTATGWPVLQAGVDAAVVVTDAETARAVHDLERLGIDSGPCGAASLAGIRALAADRTLDPAAHVLLLSTESRTANPLPDALASPL